MMGYVVKKNGVVIFRHRSHRACVQYVSAAAGLLDQVRICKPLPPPSPPSSPPVPDYVLTPLRHGQFVLRHRGSWVCDGTLAQCRSYLADHADPDAWVDERVSPGRPGMLTPVRVILR